MKFDKELLIRVNILIFGLIIMIYSLYLMYNTINPLISEVINKNISLNSLDNFSINNYLLLLVVGYIIFFIGRHWRNIFK